TGSAPPWWRRRSRPSLSTSRSIPTRNAAPISTRTCTASTSFITRQSTTSASRPNNRRRHRAAARTLQHGQPHRRTALLRNHGQARPGAGLRASKPDAPVVLDLPDGADVDLVSLHRHRSSRLWTVAEGPRRAVHGRYCASLLGGD